ncbi:MAG: TonB-dependent receptor [Ginsengibacter sp.]
MKLNTILLLVTCLQVSAKNYSQVVTLEVNNTTLENVFKEVQKQTGYNFVYNNRVISKANRVDVKAVQMPVDELLRQCFEGQPLTYKIFEKTIVVKSKKVEVSEIEVPEKVSAPPSITIKGKILDGEGNALQGASIKLKGTQTGVSSDAQGNFEIQVPDAGGVLVISYVGYVTQEIKATSASTVNIVLKAELKSDDEVVIVAFGKQKKEAVVGAVTTINPKELKVPSSNLTTALAGRLAGVIAYQRSGEPGKDNAAFFIRGVTTFGYKKEPLILIDGVEVTTTDLARLQPDDIASFSIMKDATATALYGARGANGVILVKTKEGAEGKAQYFVRFENSMSSPTRNIELADPVTYMKLGNEAVLTRDPLGILTYTQEKIDNTVLGSNSVVYPSTDWMKLLFKKHTMNQRANVNISGGGKVARYYLSGTFNQDNGILNVPKESNFNSNINLKTYSLRSNVNIKLNKNTAINVKLEGRFEDYIGPMNGGADVYQSVIHTDPVLFPAFYLPDSARAYTKHILFGNYDVGQYNNPYAQMVRGYKNYSASTINAQVELEQKLSFITQGLSLNVMANTIRYSYFDVSRFYNPFYYKLQSYTPELGYSLFEINPAGGTEYLSYPSGGGDKIVSSSVYLQGILNYQRTFAQEHTFSGALVVQMRNQLSGNFNSLQTSLPSRNLGLSGRTTYTYSNRYNAEFNFGYNGSEKFAEKNRFGFFPSFGLSWNVSNESFWEKLSPVINKLKLRGTYGMVGNDAIGDASDRFFYLSQVNMDNGSRGATFGRDYNYSRSGVSVDRYANSDITWEIAYMKNAGIEIGLFNKVNIVADFFKQRRTNILMTRASIPANVGLGNVLPRANVGEAKSEGFEVSVDYSTTINKNWWIQGRGNFTYAKSAFVVYEEPQYDKEYWLSHVGNSLSQQWGFIAERMFVDDKEVANSPFQNYGKYSGGDLKYMDVNNDGQITDLDRVPIGFPTDPEMVFGFGVSLGYKDFDFSCFLQGVAKESFWIDPVATSPFQGQTQLLKAYADSHWSAENRDIYALYPQLSATINSNNAQTSTWWMRDGSFLRLKQVEIGYSIPQKVMKKWQMNNLRFYVNGTNLFTISKFKLWDVEMAGNGLGYPIQRVINVGFHTSF